MMMSKEPPVLDDWNGYMFAELAVSPESQRLVVSDPVNSPPAGSFAPARLDATQDGAAGTMAKTAQAVNAQLRGGENSLAAVDLHGNGQLVRWFLFSPNELFMEQVLAERLKTLEIGDLG